MNAWLLLCLLSAAPQRRARNLYCPTYRRTRQTSGLLARERDPNALFLTGLLRALEQVLGLETVVDDAEQDDRHRRDGCRDAGVGKVFGERIVEFDDGGQPGRERGVPGQRGDETSGG